MPGTGSLAMCQCCCVDRLCSRGENRGTAPQLDGAVRHEPCRTAFSCRRAKSRRSYRAAARLSKNLVAFAPAGAKKVQSFSSATCAAKKILLGLQTCAPSSLGGRRVRCGQAATPLCQKVILFDSLQNRRIQRCGGFCVFIARAAPSVRAAARSLRRRPECLPPPAGRRFPHPAGRSAPSCRRAHADRW